MASILPKLNCYTKYPYFRSFFSHNRKWYQMWCFQYIQYTYSWEFFDTTILLPTSDSHSKFKDSSCIRLANTIDYIFSIFQYFKYTDFEKRSISSILHTNIGPKAKFQGSSFSRIVSGFMDKGVGHSSPYSCIGSTRKKSNLGSW